MSGKFFVDLPFLKMNVQSIFNSHSVSYCVDSGFYAADFGLGISGLEIHLQRAKLVDIFKYKVARYTSFIKRILITIQRKIINDFYLH
jgi:hypothetical protein